MTAFRSWCRALLLPPLILCVLAGCATRPQSVLKPLALAPGGDAAQVDMLVATTRKPVEDPGRLYSGDRGTAISFNSIVVSIPPDRNRKIGEIQWPSQVPANPEKDFAVLKVGKVASEQNVLRWFRKNRNAKRQAVIFVHGFNSSYSDAVFRFAQIVHDSGTDAAPILFTWPSRASLSGYLYDKDSTNYSRRALEDMILQAAGSPDVGEVTILAHSMGAWLTAEALRGVGMRNGTIPAKINNVILASPDIDVDVFRRQVIEMGPKLPHFTIFTSTEDKALGISRLISGGVNRVGALGDVDLSPHSADLKRLGITVIDTSAVDPHDPLGHNAFADSPEMIRLLGRGLAGQSLEGGQATFAGQVRMAATRTASLARSAARAAVVAPMSVMSGERVLKRDSYREAEIVDGEVAY